MNIISTWVHQIPGFVQNVCQSNVFTVNLTDEYLVVVLFSLRDERVLDSCLTCLLFNITLGPLVFVLPYVCKMFFLVRFLLYIYMQIRNRILFCFAWAVSKHLKNVMNLEQNRYIKTSVFAGFRIIYWWMCYSLKLIEYHFIVNVIRFIKHSHEN